MLDNKVAKISFFVVYLVGTQQWISWIDNDDKCRNLY